MNNKTTVIYHSADFDGLFCREIARKFLGDEGVEYIGWDFGDKPLAVPESKTIYVMDLPVDRVFGLMQPIRGVEQHLAWDFIGADQAVIWIDHHKSSIETHPTDLYGYRIDGVSACRLAWQWFAAGKHEGKGTCGGNPDLPDKQQFIDRTVTEPLAVRLAGEYDVWDKRDPDAEEFQFGLRSVPEPDWDRLLNGLGLYVGHLLERGRLLQAYQQQMDAAVVNYRSFLVEFEGLKFLALNTARCNSLTFAAKDVPETGHDALLGYHYDGQKWKFSLYHAKHRTDLDLSAIAVKHGGGGHRGACGFQAIHCSVITGKLLVTYVGKAVGKL